MLADAAEGATRSMESPTPSRIEAMVHSLAIQRLQDGQFDQCDLTMRELHRIEDSLVKSLCGMYHGRIAYPKMDTDEPKSPAARQGICPPAKTAQHRRPNRPPNHPIALRRIPDDRFDAGLVL